MPLFDNLLVVEVDALRHDALSADPDGSLRAADTPTLDALARTGAYFPRCIAASSHTTPAAASLVTGLFPPRHGLRTHYQNVLPARAATCASLLRRAGFATASAFRRTETGERQGYYGLHRDVERAFRIRPSDGPGAGVAELTRWMAARNRRGRFFLRLVATHVHDYFTPAFLRRYPRNKDADRERHQQALVRGPLERHRRAYTDAVNFFDRRTLARWLAAWSAAGLLDRTLLVVTGDHGETLRPSNRSHGLSLFESDVRVPLIFWGRGLPGAGRVFLEPVRSVDLLPTVLELLGRPVPEGLDGRSLVGALRSGRVGPRAAYSELWAPYPLMKDRRAYLGLLRNRTLWPDDLYLQSARLGTDKVVLDRFSGAARFYDLARDPGELRPSPKPRNAAQRRLFRLLRRSGARRDRPSLYLNGRKIVPGAAAAGRSSPLSWAGKFY